ncbi:MAG: helix-turn-helix domain-containing protein, partial [bacterium]
MIRVNLTEAEKLELERYRGQSSSQNSEKAFMVMLNSEGKSAVKIGEQLNRNPHTVRHWLKSYLAKGLAGLDRN